jgi:hypothetical protein
VIQFAQAASVSSVFIIIILLFDTAAAMKYLKFLVEDFGERLII